MSFITDFTFKGFVNIGMQQDWINKSNIYNQTKGWMYRDGIPKDYENPITIDGATQAYTAFYRGVYQASANNGTKNYFMQGANAYINQIGMPNKVTLDNDTVVVYPASPNTRFSLDELM